MKIRTAEITNFRGIKHQILDFVNPRTQSVRGLTCLVGDNSSGKTTALQAIALVLSMATRQTLDPSTFQWHGFLSERISSLGPTEIELNVEFSDDELSATQQLLDLYESIRHRNYDQYNLLPSIANEKRVQIRFLNGRLSCSSGANGFGQFLGRFVISVLQRSMPEIHTRIFEIGDVFWFDQYRNLGSRVDPGSRNKIIHTNWQAGVEQLREFLVGMWGFHTSPAPRTGIDYLSELEPQINKIFPGFKFQGLRPRSNGMNLKASDFYFLIQRSGRTFDIAEMSSGEQAVFALLYEFVRLRIANSIVLIDELEMHLHPPQQQALLASLAQLGPDCQFVITTHSPYLTEIIPDEQEIRLAGGRPCL